MSRITNVLLGEPIKGNTIPRKMKAANRAAAIHTVAAGAFGLTTGYHASLGNSFSAMGGLVGFLASVGSVCSNFVKKGSLKTQYNEIKTRAKQIYKK